MARPYLNPISFSAPDVDTALQYLTDLRTGISILLTDKLITFPVMCNHRASELPITPDYQVIPQMMGHQGGRYRDTILFFLTALDQRAPVYADSSPGIIEASRSHIVEGFEDETPEDATMALVTCSLEGGVLLSLPSEPNWQNHRFQFSAILAGKEELATYECINVSNDSTANTVAAQLAAEMEELVLDNWGYITGGASKSEQVEDWLKNTLDSPGLTQLVLRTLKAARDSDYYCDGELIKKLKGTKKKTVYEVRAYYKGSNNVRVLFTRETDGQVTYSYGGQKTSPNWYTHAIGQVDK